MHPNRCCESGIRAGFLRGPDFRVRRASGFGPSMEHELEHRALDALLLSGASPAAIFLSKLAANSLLILFGHLATIVLISVLLDLTLLGQWWAIFSLSVVVILGYSALATLFTALTSSTRMRGLLLPMLLLPLLFPLAFGAMEETLAIAIDRSFDPTSFWFTFLCFLDVLYVTLGLNLYAHAIRE